MTTRHPRSRSIKIIPVLQEVGFLSLKSATLFISLLELSMALVSAWYLFTHNVSNSYVFGALLMNATMGLLIAFHGLRVNKTFKKEHSHQYFRLRFVLFFAMIFFLPNAFYNECKGEAPQGHEEVLNLIRFECQAPLQTGLFILASYIALFVLSSWVVHSYLIHLNRNNIELIAFGPVVAKRLRSMTRRVALRKAAEMTTERALNQVQISAPERETETKQLRKASIPPFSKTKFPQG